MKQDPPRCDLGMSSCIAFSPDRLKAIAEELDGLDLQAFTVRYRRFADVPIRPDGSYVYWPADLCGTYFSQIVPFWREAAVRHLGILYARL